MIPFKKILSFPFCLFFALSVHAQVQREKVLDIIPPSPTAASLGRYGEIPVVR